MERNKLYPDIPDGKEDYSNISRRRNIDPNINNENEYLYNLNLKNNNSEVKDVKYFYDYYKNIIITITICMFFLMGIIVYFYFPKNVYTSETKMDKYNRYFNMLIDKESHLLSKQGWNIVNKTIYHHVFGNPTKPAIINLVGHPDNSRSFHRLITDVLSNLDISRSCEELYRINDYEDEDLFKFLDSMKSSVSICIFVENIDQIQSRLGPSLHVMTDDQNSPYKSFIMLFSLYLNVRGLDLNSLDGTAERDKPYMDVLRSAWGESMGKERVEALLARIAQNIVILGD